MEQLTGNGHSALRRGRMSVPGAVYLVTTVVRSRAPLFCDAALANAVCDLHSLPRTFLDATVMAWVLMPDHWHGVLQLNQYSLSRVIQTFKSLSARQVQAMRSTSGPVWQHTFHDRAIRNEREFLLALRYVHDNPVRAALCAMAEDYPYMGGRGSAHL